VGGLRGDTAPVGRKGVDPRRAACQAFGDGS